MIHLAPAIIFAFSSGITPGPNNLLLMLSGLNHGVKKTFQHYLGVCMGFPLMLLMIGFGLSSVFQHYPILHTILKYVGSAYMLYLAWTVAMSNKKCENKLTEPMSFIQALLFQLVNPKVWLMGIIALSTFTTMSEDIFPQVRLITIIFASMCSFSAGVWLFSGALLKKILTNKKQQQCFNWLMALLLVLTVILIFCE